MAAIKPQTKEENHKWMIRIVKVMPECEKVHYCLHRKMKNQAKNWTKKNKLR
jgi:hypothetical protein